MSYAFDADRGVHPVEPAKPQPNFLRALYDNSVSLFDSGVKSGMADAHRDKRDERAYESHRKLVSGIFGVNPTSKAYSDGYLAGFSAIASGFIA